MWLAGHGTHAPALHIWLAEQRVPHEPQWFASVFRSVQRAPQITSPSQHA
jgi:hypothetical protein